MSQDLVPFIAAQKADIEALMTERYWGQSMPLVLPEIKMVLRKVTDRCRIDHGIPLASAALTSGSHLDIHLKSALQPPDDLWAYRVCKIGGGHGCCRYLTMAPDGWSCEKASPLKAQLDDRVARNDIVARADNCEGLASR